MDDGTLQYHPLVVSFPTFTSFNPKPKDSQPKENGFDPVSTPVYPVNPYWTGVAFTSFNARASTMNLIGDKNPERMALKSSVYISR